MPIHGRWRIGARTAFWPGSGADGRKGRPDWLPGFGVNWGVAWGGVVGAFLGGIGRIAGTVIVGVAAMGVGVDRVGVGRLGTDRGAALRRPASIWNGFGNACLLACCFGN